MALNQYIGARYVPLIKGEWNSTVNYEPLTVVTYQGNSYTSICYVPTGVVPTDTSFWAMTGNYNAQVEFYRQEVAEYTRLFRTINFENVSSMKQANLKNGDFANTGGYYKVNDGGNALYSISNTEPSGYYEQLENGLYAVLIIPSVATPEMFGARGDNVHDDSVALYNAIKYCGNIACNNHYRIANDVSIKNDEIVAKNGRVNTTITGRGKNVVILNSDDPIDMLSETEATFIFDGGSFTLNGTSYVDFNNCVFMGTTKHTKIDTAFKLTPPARKLNITNSTFANLKNGIICDAGERWSGESIFNKLYFTHCINGIYYVNRGADIEISECIFQGTCDNATILKSAVGALFTLNHDYSKYGTELRVGANIVGNYFDGLGKLKIGTTTDTSSSTVGKRSCNGVVISGNTFLTSIHNQDVLDYIACITVVTPVFVSTVICDNKLSGGYDNAKVVLVDLTGVTLCGDNTIANNTGAIDYLFKGSTNSNNGFYYNSYSGFKPKVTYGASLINPNIKVINCVDGCIVVVRANDLTDYGEFKVENVIASAISYQTLRVKMDDSIEVITDSTATAYTYQCKMQITTFYIQYGTKPLIDREFTL